MIYICSKKICANIQSFHFPNIVTTLCNTHGLYILPLVFFLKTINSSIPLHLSHLHKIFFPLLHCSRVAHYCIFSLCFLNYFLFISITCISLLHCQFYLLKLTSSIAFNSTFHKLHVSSLDIYSFIIMAWHIAIFTFHHFNF